jgi:hypothetical protein
MQENMNNQNNNNQKFQQNQNQQPKPNNGPSKPSTEAEPANRKIVTIAGVILVVVILGALLTSGRVGGDKTKGAEEKTATEEPAGVAGCEPGYKFSVVTGEPCPTESDDAKVATDNSGKKAVAPSASKAAVSASGYDNTLAMYSGRTIVLGASCKANPERLTVTRGTRVLVANNGGTTVKAEFGSKTVSLRPYHYFTNTMSTVSTVAVKCNDKQVSFVTAQ